MSKICSYVWFILVIVLLLFNKVLSEDSEILAVSPQTSCFNSQKRNGTL